MLKIESELRNSINKSLDSDEKIRLCVYIYDSLKNDDKTDLHNIIVSRKDNLTSIRYVKFNL